jgi:hypothetical protein
VKDGYKPVDEVAPYSIPKGKYSKNIPQTSHSNADLLRSETDKGITDLVNHFISSYATATFSRKAVEDQSKLVSGEVYVEVVNSEKDMSKDERTRNDGSCVYLSYSPSSLVKIIVKQSFAADGSLILQFPATLNSYQRMSLHEIAEREGLMHTSVGEGASRYLEISIPNTAISNMTVKSTACTSEAEYTVPPEGQIMSDLVNSYECLSTLIDTSALESDKTESDALGDDHDANDDHSIDVTDSLKAKASSSASADTQHVKKTSSKSAKQALNSAKAAVVSSKVKVKDNSMDGDEDAVLQRAIEANQVS